MNDLSYLILMLTTRCNLACQYCYLGRHRTSGPAQDGIDMPYETIDRAIALWLKTAGKPNPSRIQITGGEPLLVPGRMKYLVNKIRRISADVPIALQTNATRLDDAAADFIQSFNLDLGVSLDGDPVIQDQVRGGAARTFRALLLLEKKQIPFNVTCVISSVNAGRLHRLVLALAGFSMARGIGFDLLVQKGQANLSNINPAEIQVLQKGVEKFVAVLERVNQGRRFPIVIREKEKINAGTESKTQPLFCHAAAGQSLAITPDGQLYPCAQTAFDPDFYLGRLPATADQAENKGLDRECHFIGKNGPLSGLCLNTAGNIRCLSCPLETACPNDCPSRLYYNRASGQKDLACTLYRSLALGVGGEIEAFTE